MKNIFNKEKEIKMESDVILIKTIFKHYLAIDINDKWRYKLKKNCIVSILVQYVHIFNCY